MSLELLPDAEKVFSAYLRSRTEITALVDNHVWTELPGLNKDTPEWRFPAIRVVRIGGRPGLQRPLYIDEPLLQLDVWGGPKALAHEIAATARAVLAEAHLATHDSAVVVTVDIGSLSYLPDQDLTPARPRYTFDATATLHP